jgi:hypothetical protein
MVDIFNGKIELILMMLSVATVFGNAIGEDS